MSGWEILKEEVLNEVDHKNVVRTDSVYMSGLSLDFSGSKYHYLGTPCFVLVHMCICKEEMDWFF